MNATTYEEWITSLMVRIEDLVGAEAARSALTDSDSLLRDNFQKRNFVSAGASYVEHLMAYDLDLQIERRRGQGAHPSEIAMEFAVSKDAAAKHWSTGFKKKSLILAWFRGDDIDFSTSFDF